jgi:hypothetical protein
MSAIQGRLLAALGLVGGTLVPIGCAPVFSDFQSAKLAGRERFEITPSASTVSVSGEDGGHVQDEYGVQVATGVLDRLDLRARYVRAEGVNVVTDKVALAVPVGFAFGKDVESGKTWAVHPTLLLTGPVNPHVEVNGSIKGLIPLSKEGGDTLVAFNVGLGLGNLEKWVIRPEVGFLFNPGESGHFTQFGIALTVFAGGRKPSARP